MRKRALNILARTIYASKPEEYPAIYALADYCSQNPGLIFGNYGERTSFNQEARQIQRDWERFCNALYEASNLGVTDSQVIQSAKEAFSGRLEWKETHWEYTTGQYWPTEYRKAGASAVERAVHIQKQSRPIDPLPEREYSISEMKEIASRSGSYFFENKRRGERLTKLKGNVIKSVVSDAYSSGEAHTAYFRFNPKDGSFDCVSDEYKSKAA